MPSPTMCWRRSYKWGPNTTLPPSDVPQSACMIVAHACEPLAMKAASDGCCVVSVHQGATTVPRKAVQRGGHKHQCPLSCGSMGMDGSSGPKGCPWTPWNWLYGWWFHVRTSAPCTDMGSLSMVYDHVYGWLRAQGLGFGLQGLYKGG